MLRRRGTIGVAHDQAKSKWLAFALLTLIICWLVCFVILTSKSDFGSFSEYPRNKASELRKGFRYPKVSETETATEEAPMKPRNLSRTGNVVATADVRGNLGPASVVVQAHPGKDWIHDRWQAASDMHGTAIQGAHWLHLDFGAEVVPETIILDWEAAYSDKYRLEASLQPISGDAINQSEGIWTVFDTTDPVQKDSISVEKKGRSPGVDQETPLHVIHTLRHLQSNKPFRYLRLHILKSAMGWGVSLWQFDVIGYNKDDVIQYQGPKVISIFSA